MSKHPFYDEVAALAEKHGVRAYMIIGVTDAGEGHFSVVGRAAQQP